MTTGRFLDSVVERLCSPSPATLLLEETMLEPGLHEFRQATPQDWQDVVQALLAGGLARLQAQHHLATGVLVLARTASMQDATLVRVRVMSERNERDIIMLSWAASVACNADAMFAVTHAIEDERDAGTHYLFAAASMRGPAGVVACMGAHRLRRIPTGWAADEARLTSEIPSAENGPSPYVLPPAEPSAAERREARRRLAQATKRLRRGQEAFPDAMHQLLGWNGKS